MPPPELIAVGVLVMAALVVILLILNRVDRRH